MLAGADTAAGQEAGDGGRDADGEGAGGPLLLQQGPPLPQPWAGASALYP